MKAEDILLFHQIMFKSVVSDFGVIFQIHFFKDNGPINTYCFYAE